MKITDLRTFLFPWGSLFLKLETDEGIAGWGECSPMNGRVIQAMVEHALKRHLIGGDPFDVEPLWDKMLLRPYKLGPSGALAEGIAGVDIALWDIKGRATGKPIYKLLGGGYRDRVKIYFSYGWDHQKSAVEVAKIFAEKVGQGYSALKLRMGWSPLRLDDPDDPALKMMAEIRAAVGDEARIGFDVNNGYTAARAIQIGRVMQDRFNIAWYEEPVPQHDYPAMAEVARALDVPVSAGEHEYTRWQFRDLILQGQPDIVQPDVVKCGGLTEAKKIAALCEAFDKPIIVHNTQPTIGTAASLHFIASTSHGMYPQEYTGARDNLSRLFKNSLEYKDGYLHVPQGAGLGLEVDEEAVKAAAV